MNFQALRFNQANIMYYILSMSVGQLKSIIEAGQCPCREKLNGSSNLVVIETDNVTWTEVELEIEDESFFSLGFLHIDFDDKLELNYEASVLDMDDTCRFDIKVTHIGDK